jgi:hypothetical protein
VGGSSSSSSSSSRQCRVEHSCIVDCMTHATFSCVSANSSTTQAPQLIVWHVQGADRVMLCYMTVELCYVMLLPTLRGQALLLQPLQ